MSDIIFSLLITMVPTRIEKPGKTGEHFPVREKSGNFTQNTGKSEKITLENWKKYWKSWGGLSASNSENPANMVPYFKLIT